MKITQIECSSVMTTPCCERHTDERIPLVIWWTDKEQWQVVRTCCEHYHELKEIHDANLVIYRSNNFVITRPATGNRRVINRTEKFDIMDYL